MGADHVTCSPELYAILGVDPQSFPATRAAFLDLVHPEDRPATSEAVRHAMEESAPLDFDQRIQRGDGAVRHLHVRAQAIADAGGKVVRLAGTAQDITDRKVGELAVESEREQLRSIVSHAPVAMAILDRDLRYVAYSERWLKYWRLRGQPLLGRRHDELFPALPEAYHDALRAGPRRQGGHAARGSVRAGGRIQGLHPVDHAPLAPPAGGAWTAWWWSSRTSTCWCGRARRRARPRGSSRSSWPT